MKKYRVKKDVILSQLKWEKNETASELKCSLQTYSLLKGDIICECTTSEELEKYEFLGLVKNPFIQVDDKREFIVYYLNDLNKELVEDYEI